MIRPILIAIAVLAFSGVLNISAAADSSPHKLSISLEEMAQGSSGPFQASDVVARCSGLYYALFKALERDGNEKPVFGPYHRSSIILNGVTVTIRENAAIGAGVLQEPLTEKQAEQYFKTVEDEVGAVADVYLDRIGNESRIGFAVLETEPVKDDLASCNAIMGTFAPGAGDEVEGTLQQLILQR